MSGSSRPVRFAEPASHDGVWADPGNDRRVRMAVPVPHHNSLMSAGSPRGNLPAALDPATPRYPVLLLNEEQVAQLLHRQSIQTMALRRPSRAYTVRTRLWRGARIVMALLLLVSAGAAAWMWAPLPVLSAFPWTGADSPPLIATGASFSLTLASPRSADVARDLERRLEAAGAPAFVRTAAGAHYVMAGPYVSLDEAETEQRRLSHAGFGGSRVFVDDSLRRLPGQEAAGGSADRPALVLVAAAHQLSLVFEFEREPQQVTTKRSADGTVLVEMGPIDGGVEPQEWSAPEAVSLLRRVKVEEVIGSPESRLARATLVMPRSTMAQARVEGRRVYVDLAPAPRVVAPPRAVARAVEQRPVRVPAPVPQANAAVTSGGVSAAAPAGAVPATPAPSPAAVESLRAVLARAERLVPFLESATRTPAPDVLRAVAANVSELEAALRQVPAAPETADAHSALTSALASARRAADGGFIGDRIAEAHQAAMLVEAAKTVLPARPASPPVHTSTF